MNFAISAPPSTPLPPAASAVSVQHRKLVDAAQQFEGMLLQEMLKPMKEHGFCQGDGDDPGDDKDNAGGGFADTLSSFGTESIATAIAKGGGLGIAKRVVEQVEGERNSHQKAAAVASPPVIPK